MDLCEAPGCSLPMYAKSTRACSKHHTRIKRHGSFDLPEGSRQIASKPVQYCGAPDCDRPTLARGLCQYHYDRKRRYGDLTTRITVKICVECGVEFEITGYGVPAERCDPCKKVHHRKTQREDRWRKGLWLNYGITPDEYLRLLEEQCGVCAICGGQPDHGRGAKNGRFAVDHHHESGRVRGLLCTRCNTAIGLFREDVDAMSSAIDYLEEHRGKAV